MRLILVLILLLIPKITKPQSVSTLMGGRSTALGNASSTLSDNWSLFNNTAGMAKMKLTAANFAYAINPSLPGADRAAASVNVPFGMGTFGAGVFKWGDELYSEQVFSTGYANQFGLASLGLKLNYVQYRAEGLGTHSALSLNFGGIAELTPKVSVGAYVLNLNQPKLSSNTDEQLPVILVSGVQFHPQDDLLLLLEIEKDLHYKPTLKGGVEYALHKKVKARTGFNLNPNAIHGGIGYQSARLIIDYALHYNTFIKTTYQLSTSYLFSKNKHRE
ncbi:MAG: hypothetical protein KDC93_01080 [Cyclobacteriaceae bacterium]|jgi:hypothetical protein|nr:hypothetical protein [Cyclobacteriaceae bacterium]